MEIGGPMASLYLLGNPDHYTNHIFVPFYWRMYVSEVMKDCDAIDNNENDSDDNNDENVVLGKSEHRYIALSKTHDYIFRPVVYEDINLYDWIRLSNKFQIS